MEESAVRWEEIERLAVEDPVGFFVNLPTSTEYREPRENAEKVQWLCSRTVSIAMLRMDLMSHTQIKDLIYHEHFLVDLEPEFQWKIE